MQLSDLEWKCWDHLHEMVHQALAGRLQRSGGGGAQVLQGPGCVQSQWREAASSQKGGSL